MMNIIRNLSLRPQIRTWGYYGSLISVLFLCLLSYQLSDFVESKHTEFISQVGSFTVVQYTLMALFMLLAWGLSSEKLRIKDYKTLLVVAITARVLLIDIDPYTSNDVDRYLFDGRIAYEGIDPYRVSHDDPQLTELRAQWQPPQEHAAYVTIYPPLALALFSLSASFGVDYAQLVWKLILLIASIATVFITALTLQHIGKLQHLPLIALSPLLIMETGVGLHLDTLSALAVSVVLFLWQKKRLAWCGIAIGVGMSLKVLPMMLLLPLIFIQRKLKMIGLLLICSFGTVAVIYSFTLLWGYHPVGSIGVFFEKWRFASPLFISLASFLSGIKIFSVILFIAAFVCSVIAYVTYSAQSVTKCDRNIVLVCMQLSLALPLLLSPVVFPWYLMPLIPLLALRPNIYLIIWTMLMPFTYEVLNAFLHNQQWQPAQWPVLLLGLFYLFTAYKVSHWLFTNRVEIMKSFSRSFSIINKK
ncbi:DUF2029 domain-containing protein [Parashewanella spongiae]|uniref:DUF2029 domain-containing protein n=1 Tax=Parashewanella spongiae TaxID=342950 RepID=A0A3A6TUX2_9GAMM|nr:glycosyltransferase 87 family protein [Parashewanella spongiae]MCL1077736.1 glycosyltransferase 87 family protein [Parashewanella spongiae]RJY18062.1 DUF2029 domain-containing protein [Parashewanella spongiae]